MVATQTQDLIHQLRTKISGQLSDKGRVIDSLLDLRSAAADLPMVIVEIDRALSDVPGLTTVENTWWGATLDTIELAVATSQAPVPITE